LKRTATTEAGQQIGLPQALPSTVWVLGFVSLLMDTSTEMIHSLLPVFLTSVLGVSTLSVGVIEGVAEATAAISKVFSGALSDWAGRRKPLVLFGYGLAALTKPVFALALSVGWVVGARFVDRLGKGIRGAPRDALVAETTPPSQLGAAFGLRQSLDTVGAFAGPVLAILVMASTSNDFRLVFLLAAIPALLAVLLIIAAVREPSEHKEGESRRPDWGDIRQFPKAYWAVIGIAMIMTLARFSEGFLLLRAQSVGMQPNWVPTVFVVMNIVYAASSYPVGHMSDHMGRRDLLLSGFAILMVADIVLALANTVWQVMAGVAFWGLHMGMTQGLLSALVADTAPEPLRATAFGVFNLASGIVLLFASVIAGGLWTMVGPAATFEAGAAFTSVAVIALLLRRTEGNDPAQ
jgi:MFS family permease